MDLSREGKKLLPLEEQHELEALYAEALQTLTPEERQQLLTIAQKGPAANDREVTESAKLIEKALRPLSEDKGARLGALVGKAVRLRQQQLEVLDRDLRHHRREAKIERPFAEPTTPTIPSQSQDPKTRAMK